MLKVYEIDNRATVAGEVYASGQRQVDANNKGAPIMKATDLTENRSQASRYRTAVSKLYLWSKISTKFRHILIFKLPGT